MKHYLTADTKEAILADLRGAGFEWYDTDELDDTWFPKEEAI